MFLIWKALNFRRENVDLFLHGGYIPIETHGAQAEHIIAFARRRGSRWAIVAVPRLSSQITRADNPPTGNAVWSDTSLELPSDCPDSLRDIFTGDSIRSATAETIFSELPFALLEG